MASYKTTRQADIRLEDIWLYSAYQWGPDQADTYLDKLHAGFQKIADGITPTRSCQRFEESAPENVGYALIEKHYVLCRPDNLGNLEILSVIHSASRDQLTEFLKHFPDEDEA